MGVLWTVWPLDDEMTGWLDRLEIDYPKVASRFPTGAEIKAVLADLDEFETDITDNGLGSMWQVYVSAKMLPPGDGAWTVLNITEYSGDDREQNLCFEKGWEELILLILSKLSEECGPLVLVPDTGEDPSIIYAESLP